MDTIVTSRTSSSGMIWAGRIICWLISAFMLFDGIMKLVQPRPVIEGTAKLGYPVSSLTGMGIVLTISVILYLIPLTAILGAILITAYLGGAVASNVRVSAPAFNISFPVIFGVLTWLGLVLRDEKLRALLPIRR